MLLHILFLSGALAVCPDEASLFITAPRVMEALSGSCLQIPCNFTGRSEPDFDTLTNVGVWIINHPNSIRYPENVIFVSSNTDNIYPMHITGQLNEKNCTTLFSTLITTYTNTYYFRIVNLKFMATAACDGLQITVKDSPPSPSIEISGDLKEKESVTITCSASTPCPHSPPELTWNLQQDSHNKIEENTDRTFTTKIQKIFTLSDTHDGLNISCSARYPVNEGKDFKTAEEIKTLNVSYAPKDTSASISPSGLVSEGSVVNLTCSSRANPPVSRFSWFKNSKDGPIIVSEGNVYSFNVTDGRVYFCEAKNVLGEEKSQEIHLTIKESPDLSLQLGAVLGGIIGIIILILCVCTLVWWRRSKSTHSTQQQSQGQTGEELTVKEPAGNTEEEDIHYGEIDFSKQRPGPSSTSEQDGGQQQDTLYAQVKVSKTENSVQPADGPEDLYAELTKK